MFLKESGSSVARLWVAVVLFAGLTARFGWADCPSPNPNLLGPPFVEDCRLPATALNRLNNLRSSPYIKVTPTGNALSTLSSFNVQTSTSAINQREYMVNFGLDATTGLRGEPGQAAQDKVGMYVGVRALGPGVGNTWAENPLLEITDTVAVPRGHHQISEMDLNNNYKAVDPITGPRGMNFPNASASEGQIYAYGLIMESSGKFPATAAIFVDGANTWHRGIGINNSGGNVIDQTAFFDYSNSPTVFDVWGRHSVGIDFTHGAVNGNVLQWGSDESGKSFLSNGSNQFGGTGDTGVTVQSSGPGTPSWTLQTIVSGGVQGRFRLYDTKNRTETFSMAPGGTLASFKGTVAAAKLQSDGHIVTHNADVTVASGFGISPTVVGNSTAGRVTVGAGGAASGTLTFTTSYRLNPPSCFAQNETASSQIRSTPTVNTLTITGRMAAGDSVNYLCIGIE
jgi:hypothetical protein